MPFKTSSKPLKTSRVRKTSSWWTGGTVSPDNPQYQPPGFGSTTTVIMGPDTWETQAEKTWGVTPSYRTLKNSGARIPPQPFELYTSELDDGPLLFLGSEPVQGGVNDFSGTTYSMVSESGPLSAYGVGGGLDSIIRNGSLAAFSDNDIIMDARLKLKDRRRTWQSAVFAAEAGKTFTMVRNTAEKIVSTLRFCRKGNVNALKQLWGAPPVSPRGQTPASLWLEFKYGWLPAISDVRTATLALDQLIYDYGQRPVMQTFKRNLKSERSSEEVIQVSSIADPFGLVEVTRLHQSVANRRICFEWRIAQTALERFGRLGLLNPAEVAWELVPLSFVVDWFVPVGGYFSQLDAGVGIEFPSGYTISSREEVTSTVTSVRSYKPGVSATLVGGSPRRVNTHVDRRVFSGGLPLASFPTLDPNLGASRLTSAIALMRTFTGRK